MGSRATNNWKIWLSLGFLAIALATAVAYQNPATAYELSTYTQTPLSFWIGTSLALFISLFTTFFAHDRLQRMTGIILGGLSMVAIISVRIIRGYYFVGTGDSLSHLGTTRNLNFGTMSATEIRYPVVHTLGSIFTDVTTIEITHSLQIFISVFMISFIIFIPVVVRELTHDPNLVHVGIFSGFLLLPINHVSGHVHVHPASQAVMYAPVVVYLFFAACRQPYWRHTALFLLASLMFVLLHPQIAANFVLFFGAVAFTQIGYTKLKNIDKNVGEKVMLPVVVVYTFIFWLWSNRLHHFERSISRVLMLPWRESEIAESTTTRSTSLTEVGGSLFEVFLKLFFVPLIFCIFVGLLLITVVFAYEKISRDGPFKSVFLQISVSERLLLLYFSVGFGAVSVLFFVYLIGGISDQYFRHYAFIMVLVTILGAIAIGKAISYLEERISSDFARTAATLGFIMFLILTLVVVFPSPYFYQHSGHVSEAQMHGYETVFEYQQDSIAFDNVRSTTSRFGTAIQPGSMERDEYYREGVEVRMIPDHFANHSLKEYYDQQMYIPVTDADRVRDPVLWNGFRFTHEDFRYLENEPGINKVNSNGGLDLYTIDPDYE